MKFSGFTVVMVVTAFLLVIISTSADSFSDVAGSEAMEMTMTTSRKLKVAAYLRFDDTGEASHVSLEDYRPYDPVPSSSKAKVRPGPIQHGTPLMPFIPGPSPPGHPKLADSPQVNSPKMN